MTAQEQSMLQGLIERVNRTQLSDKDPDAEGMLQNSLGRNPDSIYILAQTVLVQGYALEQAQRQLADLRAQTEQMRQQAQAPVKHTSFLGSLLGRDDEPARPAAAPLQPTPQAQYAPVPSYPPGAGYPAAGSFGQTAGYGAPQGGGFLRGAMQTAAGVAAGALAFEGVESLMHGFGHSAGYGSDFGGGFGSGAPREEIVNNYYGDSGSGGEHQHGGSFVGDTQAATGDVPSQDNLSGFEDTSSSGASHFADSPDVAGSGDSTDSDTSDQTDDASGYDDSGSSDFDSGASDDSGDFDSGDSGGGDGF